MTNKKIYRLNYVLNQIGKRILPYYFYNANPIMMSQWQNQICRQTHVICSYLLSEWLNKNGPNYRVQFFESEFIDDYTKEIYDHSWVFVSKIGNPNECYICDVARVSAHIGFKQSQQGNNPDQFLDDKEIKSSRKTFEWMLMMSQREFYTGKLGWDIVEDVVKRLAEDRLITDNLFS